MATTQQIIRELHGSRVARIIADAGINDDITASVAHCRVNADDLRSMAQRGIVRISDKDGRIYVAPGAFTRAEVV